MKALLIFTLTISLIGCGRGFRAGNFNSATQDQSEDFIDAYYIDESEVQEEQLELDLGDQLPETQAEEQIELPLDPKEEVKEELKPEPKEQEIESKDDSKEEPKEVAKEENKDIAARASEMNRAQLLKPTVYYLPSNDTPSFRSCKASDVKSFRAKRGQTLVAGKSEIKVCSKFYDAVQMQGSGLVRTRDGRQYLINYIKVEDGLPRYKIIDREACPYGLGMANLCLQPFISIAADRDRYKLGDVIYVPAVDKAQIVLPDGTVHQGFFIVTDTGAAIKGVGRFDFYTGPMHYSDPKNPFVKLGLQSKANRAGLTYRQVKRDSETEKLVQQYYKGRQIIPYSR